MRRGGTISPAPDAPAYAVDVSNDQAVEGAAAHFEEHLGPIVVWVNNAMVSVFSPIKETATTETRRALPHLSSSDTDSSPFRGSLPCARRHRGASPIFSY